MKWPHLDLDRALCHKPTTKNGVPHTILLSVQPVIWFEMLPCLTDWAFPSNPNAKNGMRAGEWSVTDIEHCWQRIRRRVGVTDVRIHDLRCTAASWLAINGSNLSVIQSMLNHQSLMSTQVYARSSVVLVTPGPRRPGRADARAGAGLSAVAPVLSCGRHTRDTDAGMAGIEYPEAKAVAGGSRPSGSADGNIVEGTR